MAEIKDFKERTSSTYNTYTENIFKGRYKAESKKKVDVIHEIDTAYLPMFSIQQKMPHLIFVLVCFSSLQEALGQVKLFLWNTAALGL